MIFRPGFGNVQHGAQVSQALYSGAAASWWLVTGATCIIAYQPKGAASLAASYTNLAQPGTYDAALGVAPTFDAATGWTFDGIAQFLRTNYIPSVGANLSVIVRAIQQNSGGATQTLIGMANSASPYNGVWVRLRNATALYCNDGVSGAGTARYGSHVAAVAGRQGYIDGAPDGAAFADSAQAFPAYDMYVGALHFSSTIQFEVASIQAVAIYTTALSAAQVAALTVVMAAL